MNGSELVTLFVLLGAIRAVVVIAGLYFFSKV